MTDILLPQNDTDVIQRQLALAAGQEMYQYKDNYQALNGIPMADGLPMCEYPGPRWIWKAAEAGIALLKNRLENYSDDAQFEIKMKIAKLTYKLLVSKKDRGMLKWLLGEAKISGHKNRPTSLDDYREFFKSLDLPTIATNFQEDGIFARMRVAGQNPLVIQGIDALDDTFPVTDALFQAVHHFEQDSLAEAGAEKRLYLADYVDISNIENGETDGVQKYAYAPKALFAIPKTVSDLRTALLPIAIQCGQTPEHNPIFTPSDGPAWEIAKTIVQIADFNYHELISHLGGTHLVTEPFVVSTHRQLAENHPLSVLLLPHFEGTIFINYESQDKLVADGGSFDQMFSGTMSSNRAVVGARVLACRFNDEMFPNKIKQRGVADKKLFYPYRDDAEKIWNATHKWVSGYLDVYYKRDQDVLDDSELAAWANELSTDTPKGGKVKGFGDLGDGKITTLAYLKEAVTMVIFTASAQHAAVNFSQKDFSGYPPAMPAAGYTPAPTAKGKTDQDYLDLLPPLKIADDQVDLTFILSGVDYTTLGHYSWNLFKNDEVKSILHDFLGELESIEAQIQERNAQAAQVGITPYDYLSPSKIPQSINI